MAGFSAASVDVLRYDFTGFPQDGDPVKRCTGKGSIPEPSKAQIEAFFGGIGEFMGADPDEDSTTVEDLVYELIADVCSGKPSVDELRLLPPRILQAFTRYLFENLLPKA